MKIPLPVGLISHTRGAMRALRKKGCSTRREKPEEHKKRTFKELIDERMNGPPEQSFIFEG